MSGTTDGQAPRLDDPQPPEAGPADPGPDAEVRPPAPGDIPGQAVPAEPPPPAADAGPEDAEPPDAEPPDAEPQQAGSEVAVPVVAVPVVAVPDLAGSEVSALAAVARMLGETAGAIRDAGRALTAVATDPKLAGSLTRSPRTGLRALRALAGALTETEGLGYAPDGGRLGRAAWLGGVLTSRENLAVSVAVTSLKLRVRLCSLRHPEFAEDGPVRRLLDAIEADRQLEAVRVFRQNIEEQGAHRALAVLAPSLTEVMAWNALVDENPFNDGPAWCIVTGTKADGDPLFGTTIGAWARWDRGSGRAVPEPRDEDLLARFDNSGGITAHLRNLGVIGTDGRMLVQRVTGPDGRTRYLALLAGMATGLPRNASPQDLVGAVTAVGRNDSPYTRAVRKALTHAVPEGAQLALIGHSQGGIAALNLTELPEVNRTWTLTHAVAVGSPIDYKRPHDPRTRVVSLVNEHDVVPNLEGRSPVSVFPVPEDWLEVTWIDPTHDFPQCHNINVYAQNLDDVVPKARDQVDALLADYRGQVEETLVYRLHDR